MAEHQPLKALLIILTLIALIVNVIFATIAAVGDEDKVFEREMGLDAGDEEEEERDTELTPAKWTFQIWILIYPWQFFWMFYAISLIFRINKKTQEYMYVDPAILPPPFFGIFILHLALSVTWLFAFDNEYHVASFVSLAAFTFTLYICIFFAVYLLWLYQANVSTSDMWANIILVHNGLGIYAAWCTAATLITFRTMLVETFDVKSKSAATVALVILLIIAVVYSAAEMWISKKRLRYMITPYLTFIVVLVGMIDAHDWDEDSDSANGVLKITILTLLIIATFTKCGVVIFRINKQPTKIDRLCKCSDDDDDDDEME